MKVPVLDGQKVWKNAFLLDVFNLDRLNVYNDVQPGGDGFFDFYPGITVDAQGGRIIFTKVEPFGEYLFETLENGGGSMICIKAIMPNQEKYVFRDMYELDQSGCITRSREK